MDRITIDLEIGDQSQVPLLNRKGSGSDRPQGRARAVRHVSGVEPDHSLVNDPEVPDIIRIEPAARSKAVEHRLLAWPQDCRREKVQSATLERQLSCGTLVIIDHRVREIVDPGRV